MSGFYIIPIILIVSIFYLWKLHIRQRNADKVNYSIAWGQLGKHFKAGSIIISLFFTTILFWNVANFSGQAQEDFDIFLTLLFSVVPATILLIIALIFHVKYDIKTSKNNRALRFEGYLKYALICLLAPYIIYIYFIVAIL